MKFLAGKKSFVNTSWRLALAMVLTIAALGVVPALHAQAEKVKSRAKDLKKKVEGTAPATNAPAAKPNPPK